MWPYCDQRRQHRKGVILSQDLRKVVCNCLRKVRQPEETGWEVTEAVNWNLLESWPGGCRVGVAYTWVREVGAKL